MTEPHLLTRRATPESWRRVRHLVGACLSALILCLLTAAPVRVWSTVNAVKAQEDRTSPVLPRGDSARQTRTCWLCSGPLNESAPPSGIDRRRGCGTPDGGPSN